MLRFEDYGREILIYPLSRVAAVWLEGRRSEHWSQRPGPWGDAIAVTREEADRLAREARADEIPVRRCDIRTIEAFLALVPREGWVLTPRGLIRREHNGHPECPITAACCAVTGTQWRVSSYAWAAHDLDIEPRLAFEIAQAADGNAGHDPAIRARLLAALQPEQG